MFLTQQFVNRRTGQQARIVETLYVERAGQLQLRYRLTGGTVFLDERQVRALYDEVKLETAGGVKDTH